QWALAHQLSWIEDESNQDDTYDRNFLRLRVIPVLRERWPHFSEAVARSASLCAEQEQLLDEMLAAELASLVAEDGSLAIAPLATMSPPRRAALLR
ncbi:tRNA(Ile)-lysidine synthetase, partial [Acinetobacter baumannii]|nr:tRNA(Ile)-lysidine synthetase [Acinetobacter baumannii]